MFHEQLDLGSLEQQYIYDFNNQDTWIYQNSLISVVLDTMANWHDTLSNPAERFNNVYTTPKTFKAIKHKRPFFGIIGNNFFSWFSRTMSCTLTYSN